MEPSVLQDQPGVQFHPEVDSAFLPRRPADADQNLKGSVQVGRGTITPKLGLLGWYSKLKQMQLDLFWWIRTSLELLTDFCCCWVQNVVLACILLQLVVWKVLGEARKQGQRTSLPGLALQGQLTQGFSLMQSCGCHLETIFAWMVWWPAHCFVETINRIAHILEDVYERAVRIAGEEERKEAVPPVST